jgi:hypothetical protein
VQLTPLARVALALLLCLALALVIAGLVVRSAHDSPPAPTVTARPPLEAVPVAPPH